MILTPITTGVEYTVFFGFCGPGGGAIGFKKGDPRVGHLRAWFRCLGGFDVDPRCVRDFTRLVGVPATLLDLFDRQQYIDFHGFEPPPGWREATPDDIRRSAGNEHPNVVFLSPPCKGFSGLLSQKLSLTPKYQALNRLTLRGMWLMLEAFKDDPPEFFLLENVPRIRTRGKNLIDQITRLLNAYGYAVAEDDYDCGELGELAQSRKRFLLVARHVAKVPAFLYEPPKRPLRAVGDVLSRLPLPGDPAAGPMHRIPQLQWQTWVRLAFIEAGSDWRSLNRLRVVDGKLADYLIVPQRYRDVLGVADWADSMGAVTANAHATTGKFSVADLRQSRERHKNVFRVVRWNQETGAITSGHGPTNGGGAVGDPRPANPTFIKYPLTGWNQTTGAVIGGDDAGAYAVTDIRAHGPFSGKGKYFVTEYGQSCNTVIGGSTTGHGAYCVQDPRRGVHREAGDNYFTAGGYGVTPWESPSNAIAGAACYDNGPWSVAEPRDCLPTAHDKLTAYILALDGTWHRPFTTYELAALQNLFEPGESFELDGKSDTRWREAIGNCVPPAASKVIADVIGTALLLSKTGQTFQLSSQPIWVKPLARAISVNVPVYPVEACEPYE
jgi:site-specific DNA-cytosine methylase